MLSLHKWTSCAVTCFLNHRVAELTKGPALAISKDYMATKKNTYLVDIKISEEVSTEVKVSALILKFVDYTNWRCYRNTLKCLLFNQ